MKRRGLLLLSVAIEAIAAQPCEAPAYFGICDPFVPGVIIDPPSASRRQTMTITTWPGGPADKAGVCPGDLIMKVDDVSVAEKPLDDVIRRLAVDSPLPLVLTVKRAGQELEFRMPRVRESTLAALSKQKFMRKENGELMLVPLDETREEFDRVRAFAKSCKGPVVTLGVEGLATWPAVLVWPDELVLGLTVMYSENPKAAMVSRLTYPSPAFTAGLHVGDAILRIDGRPMPQISQHDLERAINPLDRAKRILEIERLATKRTFEITPMPYRDALAAIGRKAAAQLSVPEHCVSPQL